MTKKPAVVLLSGGLDSSTCLAIAKAEGYAVHALSVAYGQRHNAELAAARRIAEQADVVAYRVATVDLGQFGGSALTDVALVVPQDRTADDSIPITYVPARNTVMLSIALAWAETLRATDIFIGVNAVDYSGYPDCRPDFIQAFEHLATLATREGVNGQKLRIHTPLLQLSKAQIIARGRQLGVDYGETVSCYLADAAGRACGHCDACLLRKKGFSDLGISDPTLYF